MASPLIDRTKTSGQPGRKDRLKDWLAAVLLEAYSGRQGVRPVTARNLVFYPSIGLAYNRIKKSGNSSMLLHLRDAMEPAPPDADQPYNQAKHAAISAGLSVRQLMRRPGDLWRLRRCWFFSVLRDPEARVLSAFLEKVGSGNSLRYSKAAGFGESNPEGFARFVSYLEAGGLYDDAHWWPQVDLLAFPASQFDAIYRLEEIGQWFPALLSSRGLSTEGIDPTRPHRIEREFGVPGKTGKLKQAASKLEVFYNDDLRRRLRLLYAEDFRVGGYPLAPGGPFD